MPRVSPPGVLRKVRAPLLMARQRLPDGRLARQTPKSPLFPAFSLSALCCWYIACFRDLSSTPVAGALRLHGVYPVTIEYIVLLAAALGAALFCLWPHLLDRGGVKAAVLLCAFFPFQFMAFVPWAWAVYFLALLSGLCLGMAAGRALYSLLFSLAGHHPARVVAACGLFLQLFLLAYAAAPILRRPSLFYAIEAAALAAGLLLHFLFDGGEDARLDLPGPRPRDAWPLLSLLVLIQACRAYYEIMLLPQVPSQANPWLRLLPHTLALLGLWLLGRRLTVKAALLSLPALLAVGLTAFLSIEGRGGLGARLFLQPFLLGDLLCLWLPLLLFRCGYSPKRLLAWLLGMAALRLATPPLVRALVAVFAPRQAALLIPAIVLIALLIPAAERVLHAMEARRAYAESLGEGDIPPPDQREDILALREKLLGAAPQAALSPQQRSALAYLIDGQDADVMAYSMGVSLRRSQRLARETLAALGFASHAQLLLRLGSLHAQPRPADYTALFEAHGLTQREKEICDLLLTTGNAQKHIAGHLGLSADTVKFHVKNIYRKLGVQSRTELTAKFAGPEGEAAAPPMQE